MKDIFTDTIETPREGVSYIESFTPSPGMGGTANSRAVFHTAKYLIQASETYDYEPWCGISIVNIKPVKIPARRRNTKYRPIGLDNFDDYYTRNYWRLQKAFIPEGEYFVESYRTSFHIFGSKGKDYLIIEVSYDTDSLEVSLSRERKPQNYRYTVARSKQISEETFKQAYLLTLEYLYDAEVALREWSSYWEQIRLLMNNDTPIKGLTISAASYFDEMEKTIKARKKRIEKQLIETDGSPEERISLRGELKGLDYCLKVIRANR